MRKIAVGLLIFGFILVFYSNFFGFDLTDEGFAVLGFTPKQELGITFTHYQFLIKALFPNGLDLILARQIRLSLIILSSALLLLSVYKSKLKNKYFFYFALLLSATTLISLENNQRALDYYGLNQFIVTLHAACLIQYINYIDDKVSKSSLWLIPIGLLISLTYLVRLPAFPFYILIQSVTIFLLCRKRKFLLHFSVFLFSLLLTTAFLSTTMVPLSRVFSDLSLYEKVTSESIAETHGYRLIVEYLYSFSRVLVILFFTAVATYVLGKRFNTLKDIRIVKLLYILLILGIVLIITTPLLHSFDILFFWLLFVTWFGGEKLVKVFREKRRILLAALFPTIALVSTLGSNVETIKMLLFYSSIWIVSYLFYVSEKNARLFKIICYFMVLLAVIRFLPISFLNITDRSIITKYSKYEMKTRSPVFLDQTMYRYVTEVRSFLETSGLYGEDILAINGLPGLVYLLDSNMPGSINAVSTWWKIYCDSLAPKVNISVIILDDKVQNGLLGCLANHGIYIKDYKLDKVIDSAFTNNRFPAIYIYTKIH